MRIGIILLCRYDSKRLPGKILTEIGGCPAIRHIVDRIRRAAPWQPLVVATSCQASDEPIAEYCRRAGIECLRGSLTDVASRFIEAMQTFDFDFGVRVNGDNVLLDPATLHAMLAIVETNQFDFVTNVPGRTFPYGMSVEVVRRSWYESLNSSMAEPAYREHVTKWLYENPELGRRYVYQNQVCPEAAGLQLALDTPKDLERVSEILSHAGSDPSSLDLPRIYDLVTRPAMRSPWQGESGPLLIAEIGGNHEGDFEVAKAMCRLAISSGADCVKFQLYRGDTLVSPVESSDRHKHFQKFELTREQHIQLAEMCRAAGVIYCASVWDLEMLEWVDPYLQFYKIGSGDLTAWPVLKEFAARGKPILLSTGLATMEEVLQTVEFIQSVDSRYRRPEMLCLMQCTSMYPIPDAEANLRVMDAYRAATGLAIGYSDHTVGNAALLASAAMGAAALEFHFTDSREGKTFRDHEVSLTGPELSELKDKLQQITALMGKNVKVPQPSEVAEGHELSFRRAAYLRRDIAEGETIRLEDVICLRPLHGLDAREADRLIGAVARRSIEAFRAIDPAADI